MTYALAWPLQEAIFQALCHDQTCATFFEHRVFDAPPPLIGDAAPEGLYLTLGDEEAIDWSTAGGAGAEHLVTLSVHAPRRGFSEAKQAAAAVSEALLAGLAPVRGTVANIRFVDARTAREENDALRRIDMRFRIRIEDDA